MYIFSYIWILLSVWLGHRENRDLVLKAFIQTNPPVAEVWGRETSGKGGACQNWCL